MSELGVYRVKVQNKPGRTVVSIQSRSPKGTPFTMRSETIDTKEMSQAERKQAVATVTSKLLGG